MLYVVREPHDLPHQFTVRVPTVLMLLGQQAGPFLETQTSLHLVSAWDISRCPGDHLDLLRFPGFRMARNPEQMYLSH